MSRVYTGGTFDLLHPGHIYLLKQCKMLAGRLGMVIVSLNTDEFIKQYKGKPPIMSYDERAEILLACKYVDEVVPNIGGADSKLAISKAKPDIIAIGIDWAVKDYHAQMQFTQRWLMDKELVLVYLPHKEGLSTTTIKERVKKG